MHHLVGLLFMALGLTGAATLCIIATYWLWVPETISQLVSDRLFLVFLWSGGLFLAGVIMELYE